MAMQQQAMMQQQMQMGMGQMGQMAPMQSPWVIYHTQQGQPYYYNEQTGRDCRTQTLLAISNMFQDTSADGNCESVFFPSFLMSMDRATIPLLKRSKSPQSPRWSNYSHSIKQPGKHPLSLGKIIGGLSENRRCPQHGHFNRKNDDQPSNLVMPYFSDPFLVGF